MHARHGLVWSGNLVLFGPLREIYNPNGGQCKTENSGKFTSLATDKSWMDDRAFTKIGLLANIDEPCNNIVKLNCSILGQLR